MRLSFILAAVFIIAGASMVALAAIQLRGGLPRSAEAAVPQVNENSINRLPTPPDLPIVEVDERS